MGSVHKTHEEFQSTSENNLLNLNCLNLVEMKVN
jgi:hypothetical protein